MTPEQVRSLIGEEVLVVAGRRKRGAPSAGARFVSEFTRLATSEGLVDVVVPLPCSPRSYGRTQAEIEEVEGTVAADLDNGSSVLVVADVTALTGDVSVHHQAATAYRKLRERVGALSFVRRTMGGDPKATASAISANYTHWERGQLTLMVIAGSFSNLARRELIDRISQLVVAVPRWSPFSSRDYYEENGRVGGTHVAVRDFGYDAQARVPLGDIIPAAAYWAVP